jgi:hypothetical protein
MVLGRGGAGALARRPGGRPWPNPDDGALTQSAVAEPTAEAVRQRDLQVEQPSTSHLVKTHAATDLALAFAAAPLLPTPPLFAWLPLRRWDSVGAQLLTAGGTRLTALPACAVHSSLGRNIQEGGGSPRWR